VIANFHSTYTPEERAAHGIGDGLFRPSVGVEAVEDTWADIEQSLTANRGRMKGHGERRELQLAG
jgi:cystathionine beta-lyase/cystathionine gamma-synthase